MQLIDEIFQVSSSLLSAISDAHGSLKRLQTAPFGGLCIFASGDFYQLPSIQQPLFGLQTQGECEAAIDIEKGRALWRSFDEVIVFNQPERSKNDPVFSLIKRRLRNGCPTTDDLNTLNTRFICNLCQQ